MPGKILSTPMSSFTRLGIVINDLMALPSNRFEALGGGRVGQYSIRVNQQWRVCLEWEDADAYNVEIVDYH